MFNPKTMVDNKNKPPVYITDFKIFNKPVSIGEKEGSHEKHHADKGNHAELFAEYIFV
jgi:hypothetical protein